MNEVGSSGRRPRVHVPGPLTVGAEATLDAERSRHLVGVLRLGSGDAVRLFDGGGDDWAATLLDAGKRVRLRVDERLVNPSESPLAITLWQGLSLGSRMDACLRQAVELGAQGFRPVQARRSQGRLDERRAAKRHEHWRAIAVSASEQCGRPCVPKVHGLATLERHLADAPRAAQACTGLALLLSPDASDSLATLEPTSPPTHIDVLIGPESGLDDREIEVAIAAGFQPVRAGPRILRTETAGPAAIAVLQSRFGDLDA